MRAHILKTVFCFILFIGIKTLYAQTDREFWFIAPEVTISHYDNKYYPEFDETYRGGEPTMIRLSTRALASEVIITQPANPAFDTIRVTLPPNTTRSINLTDLGLQASVENQWVAGGVTQKGILIQSTELITAYYEVRTKNNTDIFALKGKNALGTNFYTPFQDISYNQDFSGGTRAYSAAHIVATKDNTILTITPSGNTVDGHVANVPYTIVLQKGEAYQMAPESFDRFDRLSGSRVESNFPVAITVYDDSMRFPSNGCYDLFGDQLVPVSILGYEYIALRGELNMSGRAGNLTGETLYVTATEDNTPVYINGVFKAWINRGDSYMYEFDDSDFAVHIRSDENHPVYALHISGFGCEQGGAYLPPTSKCTGSVQVGFTRSTSEPFFMNLMVRKDAFDGFLLNGVPIATDINDWDVIPGDNNWLATKLTLTNDVPVEQQSLIVNTKDIFHMGVINGGASSGCRFGYFSDYNEVAVDAITTNTLTGNIRVCWGDPVQLEAYGGTDYVWTPDLYFATGDGHLSPNPVVYPRQTMQYTVSVTGACDIVASADVTIEVAPKIEAKFFLDDNQSCSPFTVTIDNESVGVTDSYKWSFGDGSGFFNDSTNVVTHLFENNSDTMQVRTIKLVTTNLESCRDTISHNVTIYPSPEAIFTPSITESCAPVNIDFDNSSTTANSFEWDFGDGASSSDSLTSHIYINTTGSDVTNVVRFIAKNEFQCKDTIYRSLLIHPTVFAGYTVEPVEACTPYSANFTNISIGADTFEWDFGDGTTSTSGNKNITHLYNNGTATTQTYPVSFIAKNNEGCSDTLEPRDIVVHPEIEANFMPSSTIGCDSLVVSFVNTSIGASEYEWYFGDGNSSAEISPTHIFRNLGDGDTVYTVMLVANASNLLCSDTLTQTITIHPYIRAEFEFTPASACQSHNLEITNSSVGVDSYNWSFGDGTASSSSDKTLDHLFNNTTASPIDYNIQLTASNNEGCMSILNRKFTLYPPLDANFVVDNANVCDSTEVVFTNNSIGAESISWVFGDGASSSIVAPSHVYRNLTNNTLNRTVRLIVTSNNDNCADTMTENITVRPYIKADFNFDPSGGCTPHNALIENRSVGADFYVWDLGDGNVSASAADFSHIYTNNNTTTQVLPIKLVVQNAEGCVDSLIKDISIYPRVTTHFSLLSGCNPLTVSNFNNSSVNATIFNWDFGDGASSSERNPTHTFENFSNTSDKDFTISLTAQSAYGCVATFDTTITVYYGPSAQFNISEPTGCSPYTVTIDNSTIGAVSLEWDFGDGNPVQNYTAPSFTYDYFNSTSNIINYPIELIAYSNNGCSDTAIRNAVVYPDITSSFTISSGCHPHTISDFQNTSAGAVQWQWDFGDGTTSSIENPTHVFENFDKENTKNFTVTLKTTSPTGCTATHSETISVYPSPTAEFEIGDATGCSPYIVTITNSSTGQDENLWFFGDGVSDSLNNSVSFDYEYFNSTSSIIKYPVRLITNNAEGCSDTVVRNAVVYPDIDANFSISSGCSPHLISDFNNTSVGADFFNWDFGDGTTSGDKHPSHEFVNFNREQDTNITIKLVTESIRGCKDSVEQTITIYHKPSANFLINNATGCSPHAITIANNSLGATSFNWDFDDGGTSTSTSSTLTHTYNNAGALERAYTTQLIISTASNCSDTAERVSNIYPNITSEFGAISGCQPLTIKNFNNTSIGVETYNWIFGDGTTSSIENPIHLFNNFSNTATKNFTIVLQTESQYGCTAESDTTITVYPKPLAEFTMANDEDCSPLTVAITNNAIGADSLSWNYKDGSAIDNTSSSIFSHIYTNKSGSTLNYALTLEVYNAYSCSDTLSRNVTAYSEITADFEAISGCHPHTITNFNNSSFAADYYSWDFGDGQSSNVHSPTHLFNNFSNSIDSIYTIVLKTESEEGCKAQKDTTITIYHKPLAEFSIQDLQGCSPFSMVFTDEASGHIINNWVFGDGSDTLKTIAPTVSHLYNHDGPGLALIPVIQEAVTEHGCKDTVIRNVTIFPNISSEFTIESGCEPHMVLDFNNTSIGGDHFYWVYGDGSSSEEQHPQHLFRNFSGTIDSVYTVSLRVESDFGCSAFSDTQMVVYHKPKAEFVVENTPGCSPFNVELSNNSQGMDSCVWDFNDGQTLTTETASDVNHLFTWWGEDLNNFDVELIVKTNSGCSDTVNRNATIYPGIKAKFDAKTTGCSPFTISLYNESIGSLGYDWDFGDASESNKKSPKHTYYNYGNIEDSVHNVSLIATSKYGCTDRKDTIITVYPNPLSSFEISRSPICSPDSIYITNTTIGAKFLRWNYGDGNQIFDSLVNNYFYSYTNPGPDLKTFKVELFSVNEHGCSNTLTQDAVVYPDISSEFDVKVEGCSPLEVQTINTSINTDVFEWDFGDGNESSIQNPSHIYNNYSNTDVVQHTMSLKTISKYGCTAYFDTVITVYPNPEAAFDIADDAACSPFPVVTTNNSIGGFSYKWNFDDGSAVSNSGSKNITHTYTNTTSLTTEHSIELKVANAFGCRDSAYQTIYVYPQITANFTGDFEGCAPHFVEFNNTSQDLAKTFQWYYGANDAGTIKEPQSYFENETINNKVYPVTLIAFSQFNCSDTITKDITVYPSPIADFKVDPAVQVFPLSTIGQAEVNIIDLTNDGYWEYSWDLDDGTTSNSEGDFTHYYQKWNEDGDTYRIHLHVKNSKGCWDTVSREVIVTSPVPEPEFSISSDNGCPPYRIDFTNESEYGNYIRWSFGDGSESSENNTSHIYYKTGTYDVSLVVYGDGGWAKKDTTVTIHEMPIVQFIVEKPRVRLPVEELELINTSEFGEAYLWEFGDGYSSTEFEPVHLYEEKGVYDIRLTVWTENGCVADSLAESAVTAEAPCNIELPNAFTPNLSGPSSGKYKGLEATNDIFFPAILQEGVVEYQFEVYNKWGELIFATKDKEVGWDGYYRGVLNDVDIYVWKVKAKCVDGRKIVKKGDVTLIR